MTLGHELRALDATPSHEFKALDVVNNSTL